MHNGGEPVGCRSSASGGGGFTRTALPRGESRHIYAACAKGFYLRARCPGYQWSLPIGVQMRDEPSSARVEERALRCPSEARASGGPTGSSLSDGDSTLGLRVLLNASSTGLQVEVCAPLWVKNELGVDLRCSPVGVAAAPTFLPAAGGCVALHGPGLGPLPELYVYHAIGQAVARHSRSSRSRLPFVSAVGGGAAADAAFLPLGELLDAADDEPLLQDCIAIQSALTDEPKRRFLPVGARACHVPHRIGSSLLLTLSPRFIILNRTSSSLEYRQAGCRDDGAGVLPPAATAEAFEVLYWQDAIAPKLLQLRRLKRGAEWSGGVPVSSLARAPLAGSAELLLRLRNLQDGRVEFVRVAVRRLETRGSIALSITDADTGSAPIIIHNLTRHELRFRQHGISVVSVVPPGGTRPYAWDEPARRHRLSVSLPGAGVSFNCGLHAHRICRPRLARLLGRAHVELSVVADPALTKIVVREVTTTPSDGVVREMGHARRPYLVPIGSARTRSAAAGQALEVGRPDSAMHPEAWTVELQLPKLGLTIWDESPRELLYLSLRGLRLASSSVLAPGGPQTHALAIASAQLDFQAEGAERHQQVLFRAGTATRRDALSMKASFSETGALAAGLSAGGHGSGSLVPGEGDDCPTSSRAIVLHHASAQFQEIDIRLDEDVLSAVSAALSPALGASAAGDGEGSSSSRHLSPAFPRALTDELAANPGTWAGENERVMVEDLHLKPVKLRLSLQLAPRPQAAAMAAARPSVSLLLAQSWRLLGSTLISAEGVPMRLPAIAMKGVVLPSSGYLGKEIGTRYTRALLHQAYYKLLPSSAALGDPYGMLRRLQKGWLRARHEMKRSSWSRLPYVLAHSAGRLTQSTLSNALRAGGTSAEAISRSLAANLPDGERHPTLIEALLRGVGGAAREAARGAEAFVARVPAGYPLAAQCVALMLGVPIGSLRAFRHFLFMSAVGGLSAMTSSFDAIRAVIKGADLARLAALDEPARARPPRTVAARQLIPPLCETATLNAAMELLAQFEPAGTLLYTIELAFPPDAVVLLTPSALLCADHSAPKPLRWLVPLEHVCSIDLNGSTLILLSRDPDPVNDAPTNALQRHEMQARTDVDAISLQEVVRVARLNYLGLPFAHPARLLEEYQ